MEPRNHAEMMVSASVRLATVATYLTSGVAVAAGIHTIEYTSKVKAIFLGCNLANYHWLQCELVGRCCRSVACKGNSTNCGVVNCCWF